MTKMQECVAAVDLGASGGRVIVGYIDGGKLLTEEIHRFANGPVCGDDGSLCWDTDGLFDEIKKGLKMCPQKGYLPLSVGVDTWGVDYVLFDGNGAELRPVYCYRDSRTAKYLDTAVSYEDMYRSTGIQQHSFNTVYQLLADRDAGRLDNAQRMLMLPEYFMYRLCGAFAREYTNASTTGLVCAEAREWDRELIEKLGLPQRLFEPLQKPGAKIGAFTDSIARELGYSAQVILPPTHDTAAAVAAAVGELYISSGTWSLLGIVGEPLLTDEARDSGYSNEGADDGNIRLLKNIMGMWIIQQMRKEMCPEMSWGEIVEAAESASKTCCDYALDVNDDIFLAPKSMVGAIHAECMRTGVPVPGSVGETAFCVYNSLAHCYAQSVKALEDLCGKKFTEINIIGGGSNNMMLNRLTAKYTGLKVVAGPSEATAIGNMLLMTEALGLTKKTERRKIIEKSFDLKVIEP